MASHQRLITVIVAVPDSPSGAESLINRFIDLEEVTGLYAGDALTELELLEPHVPVTRLQEVREAAKSPRAAPHTKALHADDLAVEAFAEAMRAKLAGARATGRGGWHESSPGMQQRLSDLLREAVAKGDPVDVGDYAMFLSQRGERILPPLSVSADPTSS